METWEKWPEQISIFESFSPNTENSFIQYNLSDKANKRDIIWERKLFLFITVVVSDWRTRGKGKQAKYHRTVTEQRRKIYEQVKQNSMISAWKLCQRLYQHQSNMMFILKSNLLYYNVIYTMYVNMLYPRSDLTFDQMLPLFTTLKDPADEIHNFSSFYNIHIQLILPQNKLLCLHCLISKILLHINHI